MFVAMPFLEILGLIAICTRAARVRKVAESSPNDKVKGAVTNIRCPEINIANISLEHYIYDNP